MHEYNVWYKGMVISNIVAPNEKTAPRNAKKIWGPLVSVTLEN